MKEAVLREFVKAATGSTNFAYDYKKIMGLPKATIERYLNYTEHLCLGLRDSEGKISGYLHPYHEDDADVLVEALGGDHVDNMAIMYLRNDKDEEFLRGSAKMVIIIMKQRPSFILINTAAQNILEEKIPKKAVVPGKPDLAHK
ncbi:MAG: hypothetical protein H6868_02090 [Rhodospirillales bacterium]|nr:hypothetical protein [Rhodospirillales bacterium]